MAGLSVSELPEGGHGFGMILVDPLQSPGYEGSYAEV